MYLKDSKYLNLNRPDYKSFKMACFVLRIQSHRKYLEKWKEMCMLVTAKS